MSKQLKTINKIILFPLSIGLMLPILFWWWWNPKFTQPNLTKEDLEKIEIPNPKYNGLARLNPDLKWKVPINVEKCSRGDKRYISNGLGHQAIVVLMKTGSNCILKKDRSIESSESVYLCSIPKNKKEIYIFDLPYVDIGDEGYCKKLPRLFNKF